MRANTETPAPLTGNSREVVIAREQASVLRNLYSIRSTRSIEAPLLPVALELVRSFQDPNEYRALGCPLEQNDSERQFVRGA